MTEQGPTDPKPELTAGQQVALDDALRSAIAEKETDLIRLVLERSADPNILMFAGIAYKPLLVKNFIGPKALDTIHAEEIDALSERNRKRRNSLRYIFYDIFCEESEFDESSRRKMEELNARHQQQREDYNRGFEWLKLALQFGADVNATNPDEKDPKGDPYPEIHCGYRHFRMDISNHLIANGAWVDTPSPAGNTPLIRAVADGNTERIKYYVEKGADPTRLCEKNGVFI
jgi:ankyrin repeat protein